MQTRNDDLDLQAELRALRPEPDEAFTADLDARAAAGFPADHQSAAGMLRRTLEALRIPSPRRFALPAGAIAVTTIAIATAVIAVSEDGPGVGGAPTTISSAPQRLSDDNARGISRASSGPKVGGRAEDASGSPSVQYSSKPSTAASDAPGEAKSQLESPAVRPPSAQPRREIQRTATLVLGTDPTELRSATGEVFAVVRTYDGIVLHSSVRDGDEANAAASFDLMIPSDKLGAAMAAFSAIADVRSRSDSTLDVTAPAVAVEERIRDSRATVGGLLTQLDDAADETQRAALEAELRKARRKLARQRSQLQALQRRTDLSRVSLRIEGAPSSDGEASGWGIGDAAGDAGRILVIAAGVTLVGAAIVVPLALIGLLAWLAHRVWVRRGRRHALD